jgi:flavin reductase (DIM6/NTAB) family NADH-FMN oxidoreductase RutF
VVLISVGTSEKSDVMTATATFVSEDLPLITVSVAKHLISNEIIEKSGEFVLNIPSINQVELTREIGATHGKEVNKFKRFNIETERAKRINSPLVKGCFANIECKVITSIPVSNYTLYLAEAIEYRIDDKLFPIVWHKDKYFALKEEIN